MFEISKFSVSMGDRERRIVDDLGQKKGLSFSAALRVIINEWLELTATTPTPQPQPEQQQANPT